MSSLEKLRTKYSRADLQILLINMGEEAGDVAAFIRKNGYSNTVLLDAGGQIAARYQVIGIPLAYIIDRDGMIVDKLVGDVDWNTAEIRSKIDGLL